MPRIEYAQPSTRVSQQIGERRGGSLTPLDMLLAHNDGLAQGWSHLLGAVRSGFGVSGDIREMVILRIGRLNDAPYEWDAHLPVARQESLPEYVIDALLQDAPSTGHRQYDAVLQFVDEMTCNVRVSNETFEALRDFFDDRTIAELTATIAAYNMVSRFLVALDVETADRDALHRGAGAGHA